MHPAMFYLAIFLRRLFAMAVTLLAVFTITFVLAKVVPGGPFDAERNLPEETKRALEARYKLDESTSQQYLRTLGNFARFDPGESWKLTDFTVNEIIRQGFPVSASLGICALTLAVAVGMTAGVLSATYRGSLLDFSCMVTATVGVAVPNFVLASVSVLVFVFWFNLFPVAGWGSIPQMVLPTLCLAAPYAAYIARLTRTGMLEVLNRDYIRTAYAKGLPKQIVILRHALRGAVLPVVTFLGPASAGILTGSLVVERIFNIPGMGQAFIESALEKDVPMLMAVVLLYTLLLFVTNTLVDLSYAVIDPRIKAK